jgi:S1-C subfamily serine protease
MLMVTGPIAGAFSARADDAPSPYLKPYRQETPEPLMRPPRLDIAPEDGPATASAFLIDGRGHAVTARHAVAGCARVQLVKERYRMRARVVALSPAPRLYANALPLGSSDGRLRLLAGVKPGASGAPVIGADGLVAGMVVARHGKGEASAVAAPVIAAFARAHGAGARTDSQPQVEHADARIGRAASISAGVVCLP